jgi:2'-5' RNA ligase
MIRLFAAIAIPPPVGVGLALHQHSLREARWRPAEAFHITLRFFGDLPEDQARDLDEALLDVMGPALDLTLQGVGAFGEGRDIHAVWAAVAANNELTRLAQRCERAARTAGLTPESRAYRPHVTLAYLNRPDPEAVAAWLSENGLLKSDPFTVDRFGLYSSWRTSEGSRYRLEAEYPLGR